MAVGADDGLPDHQHRGLAGAQHPPRRWSPGRDRAPAGSGGAPSPSGPRSASAARSIRIAWGSPVAISTVARSWSARPEISSASIACGLCRMALSYGLGQIAVQDVEDGHPGVEGLRQHRGTGQRQPRPAAERRADQDSVQHGDVSRLEGAAVSGEARGCPWRAEQLLDPHHRMIRRVGEGFQHQIRRRCRICTGTVARRHHGTVVAGLAQRRPARVLRGSSWVRARAVPGIARHRQPRLADRQMGDELRIAGITEHAATTGLSPLAHRLGIEIDTQHRQAAIRQPPTRSPFRSGRARTAARRPGTRSGRRPRRSGLRRSQRPGAAGLHPAVELMAYQVIM